MIVASGVHAADAHDQLQVSGHHRHALGVDGNEVGVLEKPHEEELAGFLDRQQSVALKTDLLPEGVVQDLPHEPLEGDPAPTKQELVCVLE